MTTAQRLIEAAYRGAKHFIESDPEGAEAPPMAFLRSDKGEVAVMPMPWSNDREKDAMMGALRKVCGTPTISAYAISSEAWMLVLAAKDGGVTDATTMPRNHPDRVEVVNIVAQERGGKMLMATATITRHANGRRSVGPCKMHAQDDCHGRMVNLFEPLPSKH